MTKILEAVESAAEQHRRRISTATLNLVIREAVAWKPPPCPKGSKRRARIYYATQVCCFLWGSTAFLCILVSRGLQSIVVPGACFWSRVACYGSLMGLDVLREREGK